VQLGKRCPKGFRTANVTNLGQQQSPFVEGEENAFSSEMRFALAELTKARDYARELECDPWEFAVEIDRLISLGITTSDLRWLAKKGYIEHSLEVTQPEDSDRRFQHCQNLSFTKKSCFLLTDAIDFSLEDAFPSQEDASLKKSEDSIEQEYELSPHWDCEDRILYVGDLVVKEYRVLSPNQEAVLSAFQEEDWPHYIDDPLSPVPDQNPKQRLRDTIRCLNANQKSQLVRFRGDGTGERVRWELIGVKESVIHSPKKHIKKKI
jgi:hypothetical protein